MIFTKRVLGILFFIAISAEAKIAQCELKDFSFEFTKNQGVLISKGDVTCRGFLTESKQFEAHEGVHYTLEFYINRCNIKELSQNHIRVKIFNIEERATLKKEFEVKINYSKHDLSFSDCKIKFFNQALLKTHYPPTND